MTGEDIKVLNVPAEDSVRYGINFIKTAVCELRFPTLLEIEDKPPIKFQSALRKHYPYYTEEHGVSLTQGAAPSSSGKRYRFESKKKDWTIALKANSISLETNSYIDFKDFYKRFQLMLDTVGGLLDTDFFTRVGLRYINSVPLPGNDMDSKDIHKWINPVLVAPLKGGELGTLTMFNSEIGGHTDGGKYTFRHGFARGNSPDKESISYMLDYDYFQDGVEYNDVYRIISEFNSQNFNLFKWSLGEESIKVLVQGENKI